MLSEMSGSATADGGGWGWTASGGAEAEGSTSRVSCCAADVSITCESETEARWGSTKGEDKDRDTQGMSSDRGRGDPMFGGRSTGPVWVTVDIGIGGGAEIDTTGDGTMVKSSLLCEVEPPGEIGCGMG